MEPCPVCSWPGGFHNRAIHDTHEVPRELLLQPGWHKPEVTEHKILVDDLMTQTEVDKAWDSYKDRMGF